MGDARHPLVDLPAAGQAQVHPDPGEDEIEELYDLEADPHEMKNLALHPAHRTLLAQQRDRFVAELRRTKAGLVDNLPRPRTAE